METDVLVIGSGIAGLTYAVNLAMAQSELNICILTKPMKKKPIPNMPKEV